MVSMEPRFSNHGDHSRPGHDAKLPAGRFQWSHGFNHGDCSLQMGQTLRCTLFQWSHGFQPWRLRFQFSISASGSAFQWNTVFNHGDARPRRWRPSGGPSVSMEPRFSPWRPTGAQTTPPAVPRVSNGATVFQPWRPATVALHHHTASEKFGWSHGFQPWRPPCCHA